MGTHQIGGVVSEDWFRRRDADGCDRDGRAPQKSLIIQPVSKRTIFNLKNVNNR
jgi:hypothetical protein